MYIYLRIYVASRAGVFSYQIRHESSNWLDCITDVWVLGLISITVKSFPIASWSE